MSEPVLPNRPGTAHDPSARAPEDNTDAGPGYTGGPGADRDTAGAGQGATWAVPAETRRERRGHDFYPPAEQIAVIPIVDRARAVEEPLAERVMQLHYFGPVGDWWLTALDRGPDPEDWLGYGYVRLAGLEQFAEWGDVSLPELEALHIPRRPLLIVERDLWWTPRPFGQIGDLS